ncbi:hypothetical protein ACSBR1_001616 [Camellia fascicularis]
MIRVCPSSHDFNMFGSCSSSPHDSSVVRVCPVSHDFSVFGSCSSTPHDSSMVRISLLILEDGYLLNPSSSLLLVDLYDEIDPDLQKATCNFTILIGQGAFGSVYKAQMLTGETVAVKVLAIDSNQGAKEFQTEMVFDVELWIRLFLGKYGRHCVDTTYFCSCKLLFWPGDQARDQA